MMRRRKRPNLVSRLFWLALIGALSIFTLGLYRYGGPAGLWRRTQIEMASWQPHPDRVPTPLPFAGIGSIVANELASNRILVAHTHLTVILPTVTPTPRVQEEVPLLPPPTATPLPYAPAAPAVELTGLQHVWQTWNNCGPATLSIQLSYFGRPLGQETIGAALRTNPDDKNVNPEELAAFAHSQGFLATVLVNGSADLR
jgi:hypothetical protein